MFCPKCGQEQALESVHFCARCGVKLNPVEEALGTRLVKVAMYLVLTICSIFGWGSFTAGPGYMQVRLIITIIAAVTFFLLFSRDLKYMFHKLFSETIEQQKELPSGAEQSGLPMQGLPLSIPGSRRINTAEMVQPPSITERTTLLLDKNSR